jgi:hypothetical protein
MRRISLVPAPISYSLASRSNRPVGYSFTYPLPPKHWIAWTPSKHHKFCISSNSLIKRSRLQTGVHEKYGMYIYIPAEPFELHFQQQRESQLHNPGGDQKKIVNGNWKSSTVYTVNRSSNLGFELAQRMLILISLLQSINSPRNKETKTSRNYDNNNTFLSECPESHIRATEYTKDLWRRTHPQFCTV